MSAFSTAKVIRSSIRKIYIPIIVLLVFCIPFLGFTEYAYADTVQDYEITENASADKSATAVFTNVYPDNAEATNSIVLGTASIGGVYYSDLTFDATIMNYRYGEPSSDSYTGYQSTTNFNYKPMYATLDNVTSHLSVEDFDGYIITMYLPTFELYSDGTKITYSGEAELVSLTIGGSYGSVERLFIDESVINGIIFSSWDSENFTYWHFMINSRFNTLTSTDYIKYYGSFSNYTGDDLLTYIAMSLCTVNFWNYAYTDSFNNKPFLYAYTDFYVNINYFANQLTEYEKELLSKIESLEAELEQVNNNINDLLNYGSGSFDDLEQDIGNASDKAEQGNQEIQDNAPKPDIDNTHDDTTNIIDTVLTEHGENVSNILGAILGSNIINGMLLISISVGAIKYIFFGKG